MRRFGKGPPTGGALALALAIALAACGRGNEASNAADANAAAALPPLPPAVPLAAGPAAPAALAPAAAGLPDARPIRRARFADPGAGYAYLDRAWGQADAVEGAPPDYAFDYGPVRPWTWEAADRSREIVEPVSGGWRYYYYQPGADTPYLVRDPSYVYAYDGPALVEVWGADGAPPPPDPAYRTALFAARYLARAQALYAAAAERPRLAVAAADWSARAAQVSAARAAWSAERARDAEWAAYHAAHDAEEQAHWADERARRAAAAERFDEWRARSFGGPPPVLYASAPAPRRLDAGDRIGASPTPRAYAPAGPPAVAGPAEPRRHASSRGAPPAIVRAEPTGRPAAPPLPARPVAASAGPHGLGHDQERGGPAERRPNPPEFAGGAHQAAVHASAPPHAAPERRASSPNRPVAPQAAEPQSAAPVRPPHPTDAPIRSIPEPRVPAPRPQERGPAPAAVRPERPAAPTPHPPDAHPQAARPPAAPHAPEHHENQGRH